MYYTRSSLKRLRRQAHQVFDKCWKTKHQRSLAYEWLSENLEIPLSQCHFAMFSEEQCSLVMDLVDQKRPDFTDVQSPARNFELPRAPKRFHAYFSDLEE